MSNIRVFSDLSLTKPQRLELGKVIGKASPEARQAVAHLCSAMIRADGDAVASDAEMVGIKTVGDLIDSARSHAFEIPLSTWARMTTEWESKALAKKLSKLVDQICWAAGDRTIQQAQAITQAADLLTSYTGAPADLKVPVGMLRNGLQGHFINVPLTGVRDGKHVDVTYAVDADAMQAALLRLVEQGIPKILPEKPVLKVHSQEQPMSDGEPGWLIQLSGPTVESARIVPMAICRGVPLRTFWTQPDA